MVTPEYEPVAPTDLWPNAVFDRWPNTIPVHGITILDALRPDGHRGLHVVHDTGAPPWVLIGMLRCVIADLEATWIAEGYEENDDDV